MRPQCMQCFHPMLIVKFAANGTRRYLNNKGETAQDVPFKRPVARMPPDADPQQGIPSAVSSMCHRQTKPKRGESIAYMEDALPTAPAPGKPAVATHRE